jgi:cytochrome c1
MRYQQKFITEAEEGGSSEHDLWTAVLSKAAHDAVYSSDWRESKKAIAWFKEPRKDFKDVCQYAGRNPDYVFTQMQKPIQKREQHMEMVCNSGRYYVKETLQPPKQYRNHYRGKGPGSRGPYQSKVGRPRKKDLRMVLQGRKGGRPRLYAV